MKESCQKSGALSGHTILKRLELPESAPGRLRIVPCFPDCVKGASVDLHLGYWFRVARRTRLPSIRLGLTRGRPNVPASFSQEKVFVAPNHYLTMHPGDLVLGATLEFLAVPNDLVAFVEGKSRIGREGLIVATAPQIAPTFHGVVILELVNAGMTPLELEPGIEVCQVIFHTLTEPVHDQMIYKGRSYCQTEP